ncbi:MAG: septum formation initiator family protein [Firmicutes bacterium]|nr:septum formation initiator family protein [Bacillota bacterium]
MEYGNLAYKLPEQYEEPIKRKRPQANRVKIVKRNREQMLSRSKNIRRICAIVVIAISAGFMISQFVTVNETEEQVATLQKELAELESATSQMIFDLEQSVDLDEIEEEATTRLGMQRPEKYQTIYVNVKQDDVTEKTASEVEGFGNSVMSALKKIGSNIVQFFSIK